MTFRLIPLLALLAALLAAAVPAPASAAPAQGVYLEWAGNAERKLPGYEAFLGRRVDLVQEFATPWDWERAEFGRDLGEIWRRLDRRLLFSFPVLPGAGDRGGIDGYPVSWEVAARGDYDQHWRRLGRNLVAAGQANAILRPAYEFNGGWFAHRVEVGEEDAFIASWRRMVDILRATPGQRFTFVWNPNPGISYPGHPRPEDAWPGGEYVDYVGLSFYDDSWAPDSYPIPEWADRAEIRERRDRAWRWKLDQAYGVSFWRGFAKARGKPMAFPEWGLRTWVEDDGVYHGGGDNPEYVRRMRALFDDPAYNVAFHAAWEDRGLGFWEGGWRTPRARATFLRLFGEGRFEEQEE